VFAAQMINFPVGNGTSGHLVGGALLSYTLGPAPASIVMTAILITQALVFQDGGLLALGANVFNMAVAGVLAGYLPYAILRGRSAGIFLGGMLSVMVSACFALGELILSGVPMPTMALAISLGLFAVSALCEGAITLAITRAMGRIQPDFMRQPESLRRAPAIALGLASAALVTAGAFITTASPDGVQRLVSQSGFSSRSIAWLTAPMADYRIRFLATPWIARIAAGLTGILLIYAFCVAVDRVLGVARPAPERDGA
jgi:cobalt/nickel transport system permease protein